jgi:hypothetical protein
VFVNLLATKAALVVSLLAIKEHEDSRVPYATWNRLTTRAALMFFPRAREFLVVDGVAFVG